MAYINSTRTVVNNVGTDIALAGAGNLFTVSGSLGGTKSLTLSDGFINNGAPEANLIVPLLFPNGHNDLGPSLYLEITVAGVTNPIPVVSNQNGTLLPIPHHEMLEGGSTVYKVVDPNTILNVYYTADYDGSQNPAFVVVGNPLVLSSSTYSIYANGKSNIEIYSTTETKTNKVWIDGKPIYRRTFEVYKNNVLNGWTRSGNAFTYQGNDLSIDELISNSAITTNGILTMWVNGTYGLDNPYGISHYISSSKHVWTIINSDGGQFSGTKCILTIEYTKTTD